MLPLDALSAAQAQLQEADTVRGTLAGLGLQAAADALLEAKQSLSGSEAQLGEASTLAQAYVAAYYPAGGASLAEWSDLVAALQSAASAMSAVVSQAPADAAWSGQVSLGMV